MISTAVKEHNHANTPTIAFDDCAFCSIEQQNQIIASSKLSLAFPSYGAMIDGWTLVSPRNHVASISELTATAFQDLLNLSKVVQSRIFALYGQTVTFEHGPAGHARAAGCGVDHAHLHIVPTDLNIRDAVNRIAAQVGSFRWEKSYAQPIYNAKDYIWISDATGSWITYRDEVPSQVVRRAIAAHLGEPTWDWKEDHRYERVGRTFSSLT